jgi:hypothetical protein
MSDISNAQVARAPFVLQPFRKGLRFGDVSGRLSEISDDINRANTGTPPPALIITELTPAIDTLENISITIDGAGSAITSAAPTLGGATVEIPTACQIVNWTVEADASGSIAVDVKRANKAVPSASIVGTGNKPTLATNQYASAAPSGWTSVALEQGDIIGFAISGTPATVQRVTVTLRVQY